METGLWKFRCPIFSAEIGATHQARAVLWCGVCLLLVLLVGRANAQPLVGEAEQRRSSVQTSDNLPRLTWCINHFPRWHEYPDDGEPFGPSVDFMGELADRAGFELAILPRTPIARCLRLMELGQVDLMSNLNYSTERAAYMHLIPLVENEPESLWLRCGSPYAEQANRHLDEMRLITLRGSTRTPEVTARLNDLPKPVTLTETWEKAFEMVRRGRVDAVIAPTASAYSVVESNRRFHGFFCPVHFLPDGVAASYIHVGLAQQSPHSHLYAAIEAAIENMREDGSLQRMFPMLGAELPDPP